MASTIMNMALVCHIFFIYLIKTVNILILLIVVLPVIWIMKLTCCRNTVFPWDRIEIQSQAVAPEVRR